MAGHLLPRSEFAEALRAGLQRSSRVLLIVGIALIVLGSIAIIVPEVATLFAASFIERRIGCRITQLVVVVACLAVRTGVYLSGKFNGAIAQVFLNGARIGKNGLDDLIDQPEVQCSLRTDRPARYTQVNGCGDTNNPRQPLCSLGAGNDAEIDFRLAHLRVVARNPIVSGHGKFEASTESGAVYSHDDGLGKIFDPPEKSVHGWRTRPATRRKVLQFPDIGPRDKCPPGANDHDRSDLWIPLGIIQRGGNSFRHTRTNGVHRRVVDCHYGYIV